MRRFWLVGGAALALAAGAALFGGSGSTQTQQAAEADAFQPIQFPHDVHAGTFNIGCEYCHYSAERSVDAGIPPVATCVGCHQVVRGREEPARVEIEKTLAYADAGEPIPWRRIYKVSDHVRFPHFRHIAAEISCQTCHGEVQLMGVLEEMAPESGNLKMGWCVSCHLERDVSRDCTVCHY